MATVRFTKQEFEDALPRRKSTDSPLWSLVGVVGNEYQYRIDFDDPNGCHLIVRSSINPTNDMADDSGEDSIRVFLMDSNGDFLTAKNASVQRWVTRQENWKNRLYGVFAAYRKLRHLGGDCPVCGKPNKLFKIKKRTSMNWGDYYFCCSSGKWEHYRKSYRHLKEETFDEIKKSVSSFELK
jgi:hypothetical protein